MTAADEKKWRKSSQFCRKCRTPWPEGMEVCPHDGDQLIALPDDAEAEAPPSPLERIQQSGVRVGDEVGAYHLVELLGEGGMATVFKAEHRLLQRVVALKFLLPELQEEITVVHRFFKEARAVNQIQHPHIVEITDFIDDDPHAPPYVVMEFLEGESLFERIQRVGNASPEFVVEIGLQICDAMAAVHRAAVVHRDLKPENVMLIPGENDDDVPEVKLLDFGIAKFLATEDSFLRTRTGQLLGTPEYMPPEQIRGLQVDKRADIYSLGVILFEMLAGRRPFQSDSLQALFGMILNTDPPPPSSLLPAGGAFEISAELDEIVVRCMAKQPQQRFGSMEELAGALELTCKDPTEVISVPVVPRKNPQVGSNRWSWIAVSAGGVLVAILLGLLVYYKFGDRQRVERNSQNTRQSATFAGRDGVGHSPRRKSIALSRSQPQMTRDKKADLSSLGKVRIVSRPVGAQLFRLSDGTFVGITPVTVEAQVKPQTYELRLAGYASGKVTVDPTTGSVLEIELKSLQARGRTPSGHRIFRKPRGRKPSSRRTRLHRKSRGNDQDRILGTVNPFE